MLPHLHAEGLAQLLVLVEVDLEDYHLRVLARELAQLRVQRLARAAPVGVEVNHNETVAGYRLHSTERGLGIRGREPPAAQHRERFRV